MRMIWTIGLLVAAGMAVGCQNADKSSEAAARKYSGTWKADGVDYGGDLHCVATAVDDTRWKAKFSGYCGRDFLYDIPLEGTREGDKVVFAGEVDLGEKDGGVYVWTGAMEGDTFSGKYASRKGARGSFTMTRQ